MRSDSDLKFLTGFSKALFYLRVVIHVVLHAKKEVILGRMRPWVLLVFLYRACLFLKAVSHSKVVARGGRYKLHLYIPAYPTAAFFHTLKKLTRSDPGPVTVVLSMTRACNYKCSHCYQQKDRGKDIEIDRLISSAQAMQELGVSLFDIEGGEPLLRFDRLLDLMGVLDRRAEIWINTTGAGLTREKVSALKEAGLFGVMVSLHAPDPETHDAFTGVDGAFDTASAALRLFHEQSIFTAINCCPSLEMVAGGGLERIFDLGRDLQTGFVQVIHGKASGGWLGRKDEISGSKAHIEKLCSLHLAYNRERALLDHPSVSAQVFEEGQDLFGCTAGGVDRFYLGADGEVQPCEFLNISFGNVNQEEFETIFKRMRSFFQTPGCDWLCCTQAEFIHDYWEEHGLQKTPIPWEHTQAFIRSWDRGRETELYRKLGIYPK